MFIKEIYVKIYELVLFLYVLQLLFHDVKIQKDMNVCMRHKKR